MLLQIPSVLTQDQLDAVRKMLATASFVDGKLSAGMAAKRVKHNEELDRNAKQMEILNNIVMGSLVQHPVYRNGALPPARGRALLCTLHPGHVLWRSSG